jgi:Ca2+-transporting ATPase
LIVWSLLQGFLAFAIVAGIYLEALGRAMPTPEVRALTFFSLVLTIVALIFANRSFRSVFGDLIGRSNRTLGLVLVAVAAMLATTLLWPEAMSLLRFGPLHAPDLAVTLGAGLGLLVVIEVVKPAWRAHLRP